MRIKADDVIAEDPKRGMENFKSLLVKLVKVPKSEIPSRRKRSKKKRKA